MKTVNTSLFIFLLPIFGLAQKYTPRDFCGTIRIEDNKTIDFTYLNNPEGGTVIYYFTSLPDARKYKNNLKRRSMPFQTVRKIEFLPETIEETQYLQTFCRNCNPLTKAKVFYNDSLLSPDIFYLAFDRFEWKSNIMKGFGELRVIEARFIDEVTIKVRK